MKIRFRRSDMGMAHEALDRLKIISLIEEGSGKSMPHDMRVYPLLDHGLFYHGSDETVNRFSCQPSFRVGSMLSKGLKEGMIRIGSIPGSFQVVLGGDEGLSFQRDAPELLTLPDHVESLELWNLFRLRVRRVSP